MNFFSFIFSCLYFFLPAYFTNVMASLSKKIKIFDFFSKPLNGRKIIGGYPIFGPHKTWRGIIVGGISGFLIALLQKWLYQYPSIVKITFFDYEKINIFLFGFLITLGAIFGDLVFAFFKRRQNIKPGQPWIPFDQINFVIGAFLFLTPYLRLEIKIWLTVLVFTFVFHVLANHIAYFLGWQKTKW